MKSGVSRDQRQERSQALDSAREAARRSGLTLGEWLDSVISASTGDAASTRPEPSRDDSGTKLASISAQLLELATRLDRITPAPVSVSTGSEQPNYLAETLERLNAQLDGLIATARPTPPPAPRGPELDRPAPAFAVPAAVKPAPAKPASAKPAPASTPSLQPSGPLPEDIERAVAEIAARQRQLDSEPAARSASRFFLRSEDPEPLPAPNLRERTAPEPTPPVPDLSRLESQLRYITEQIEALRRPCGVESEIGELRRELAEVYRTIADAMPRRAVEALQIEVRSLSERIDDGRNRGADKAIMEALERGLAEVRDALHDLKPAESLAGLEQTIKTLAHKIDALAASGAGESALQQVQDAISELRAITSGAASGEMLSALAAEVHRIAAKIDRLMSVDLRPDVQSLSTMLNALSDKLEQRGTGVPPENLDVLLNADFRQGIESVSERIGALSTKIDQSSAQHLNEPLYQIEAQIAELAATVSKSAPQPTLNLDSIERSLNNLAIQIGEARVTAVDAAERAAKAVVHEMISGSGPPQEAVDSIKRDLSDLRATQTESERKTQDTLEAVRSTLERLMDRLGTIELDRREARLDMAAQADAPSASAAKTPARTEPSPKPAPWQSREPKPIDPSLPADHPLEPGSVSSRGRPADRALDRLDAKFDDKRDTGAEAKPNFIAAARRAARAAQSESAAIAELSGREPDGLPANVSGLVTRYKRPILLAIGAILLVIGTVHIVVNMLGKDEEPRVDTVPPIELSSPTPDGASKGATPPTSPGSNPEAAPAPRSALPAPSSAQAAKPSGLAPITRSVVNDLPPSGAISSVEPPSNRAPVAPSAEKANDTTGSVFLPSAGASTPLSIEPDVAARAGAVPGVGQASLADKLPASIGSPVLRSAAEHGDAAAEYEIGIRYADGRGVPQNYVEAARWLDRAANRGVVPAQYRLGSLYEKGMGVKKDLEAARKLYIAAGDKGNAKAMHNLAVLYAEGLDGKPDYRTASQWFRRAADHGIADSQYNLGILYARGIGVDQNLAESYKWFALAANQGDQDAGKKRDDVAQRLDAQSLVAARLAVQTWAAQPQPETATTVKAQGAGPERPANAGSGRPKPLAAPRKATSS